MIYKRLEHRRAVWEITLAEKRVTIIDDGLPTVHEHPSVEKAQYFVADRVREQQSNGFREVAYEESYDGGARDAALEAAIAATPADPASYLVYADWLQQRGEPRGELIALQHAMLESPNAVSLRTRQAELFADHSDRLLGPLALVGNVKPEWYCGFVRSLELSIWLQAMGKWIVTPLLTHPSMQFIVELTGSVGNDTDIEAFGEHAPVGLERLELAHVGYAQRIQLVRAFRRTKRSLPRLTRIVVGRWQAGSLAEWLDVP